MALDVSLQEQIDQLLRLLRDSITGAGRAAPLATLLVMDSAKRRARAPTEQLGKKLNLADQDEVAQRRGIAVVQLSLRSAAMVSISVLS